MKGGSRIIAKGEKGYDTPSLIILKVLMYIKA